MTSITNRNHKENARDLQILLIQCNWTYWYHERNQSSSDWHKNMLQNEYFAESKGKGMIRPMMTTLERGNDDSDGDGDFVCTDISLRPGGIDR